MDKEIALAVIGLIGGLIALITVIIKKWPPSEGKGTPPPPPPSGKGINLTPGRSIHLFGTWVGVMLGDRYSLDGTLRLNPDGAVGEMTWTLEDAGRGRWLKTRRKPGDKGVESVQGSYQGSKLFLKGLKVDDEVLIAPADYELTLTEDGKFQGISRHTKHGEGKLDGTAQVFS